MGNSKVSVGINTHPILAIFIKLFLIKGKLFWGICSFSLLGMVLISFSIGFFEFYLKKDNGVIYFEKIDNISLPYRERSSPKLSFKVGNVRHQLFCIHQYPCMSMYDGTRFQGRNITIMKILSSKTKVRGVIVSGELISLVDGKKYNIKTSSYQLERIMESELFSRVILFYFNLILFFIFIISLVGLFVCFKFDKD